MPPAGCRLRPAERKQVGRLHARSPRRPGHDRRERQDRSTRGRHPHGAGGSPGARRPGGRRAAGGAGRDEADGRRDDGQARDARRQPPHGDARPADEGRALRGNATHTWCRCEGQAPRANRPWGARTLREGGRKGAPSHDAGRWTKADAPQSETRTSQEGGRWSENADLTCETPPFDGPLSASPAFPQFKSMRILRWRSMRLRLEVKSALSDHLNVRTAFSDQKRGRKATISQRGERRRGRRAGRDEAAGRGGAKRGRETAGRGEGAGTIRRGEAAGRGEREGRG